MCGVRKLARLFGWPMAKGPWPAGEKPMNSANVLAITVPVQPSFFSLVHNSLGGIQCKGAGRYAFVFRRWPTRWHFMRLDSWLSRRFLQLNRSLISSVDWD